MIGKILVIDDEPTICSILSGILNDEGYSVFTAGSGDQGLHLISKLSPDLCFLDVWLPGTDGVEVLEKIKNAYPEVDVIMISGHANVETAVRCVRAGALDFIEKPLSLEKIVLSVENALRIRALKNENSILKSRFDKRYKLLGKSDALNQIKETIKRVSNTQSTILITGENGTGKENVARNIHDQSNRSSKPFVAVNCAAIPEDLIESELFGHEKGAFTGATVVKRGKFELAHTGTLFLDEIGDMSIKTQSKLLRVLQEQRIERLGSQESIEVDVRIISATNRNIEDLISKNIFREDLFYRINVIPIFIPPLRERIDDILDLCEYFLDYFSTENGIKRKYFSTSCKELLLSYSWPGNVRELKNVMERLTILVNETCIEPEHLPSPIVKTSIENCKHKDFFDLDNFREARAEFEKAYLKFKLFKCGMVISKTAELIGLERTHLHKKLRLYGIVSENEK